MSGFNEGQHPRVPAGSSGGGQFASAGAAGGVSVNPSYTDSLSLEDNKAMMRGMVQKYREDKDFRGAATVVSEYARMSQNEGLATRAIVERTLSGRTPEQILADPRVQKLLAEVPGAAADAGGPAGYVKMLAESAPGYYKTIRDAHPTTEMVYRGAKGAIPKGDEVELRGPTAFSHHLDSAMTYSGGVLYQIKPGAKMLPVSAMAKARRAATEGGDTEAHATVPSFYKRSSQAVHPLGVAHGYTIDFDTDRELSSAGRFRVAGTEERRIGFTDGKSGSYRLKTVKVVTLEQIGVF